jgi:glycosyltransferase involved in cell wall biosynthesis
MLLWMTRTPFVTWCRGGELDYWHESSWFRRFVVSLAVRTAGLVAYKESAMMSRLDALGVPLARRHFFYNCIPFNAAHPTPASERRNVLFANSWKVWRRPDVALGVAVRLAPRFPDVEFTIAGHRSWVQEPHSKSEFEKRLREAGLSDRVRLLPFVEDPGELMRGSGIFLLPSELVFPNYALLEAMERGLVPVVSAAPDADKIVTDGQEGFLVDGMDEEKFTDRVRSLLENGAMRERMAYAAREKIRCKFNLSTAMPELLKAFQRCVWKRRPGRDSFCLRDGELASSCLLNDE